MGLVRFPNTLVPYTGRKDVETECADNAHVNSSSLTVFCNSGGSWSGEIPRCECDTGYREKTVSGRRICEG